MKITIKGQVTIPQKLRNRFGLLPHTEVVFTATEDGVLVKPIKNPEELLDERLERATGSSTIPITTSEAMRMTRGGD